MGLLNQVLESLLRGQAQQPPPGQPAPQQGSSGSGLSQAQLVALVSAVVALLNDPRIGGIDGLVRRFQESGLGDLIGSWVGTGQNRPIDPGQLGQVLPGDMTEISSRAGLPQQEGESILAKILPQLIDQLTPGGRVPQGDQLSQLGSELLKGLFR